MSTYEYKETVNVRYGYTSIYECRGKSSTQCMNARAKHWVLSRKYPQFLCKIFQSINWNSVRIKPSLELDPILEYRLGLNNVNGYRTHYNQMHKLFIQPKFGLFVWPCTLVSIWIKLAESFIWIPASQTLIHFSQCGWYNICCEYYLIRRYNMYPCKIYGNLWQPQYDVYPKEDRNILWPTWIY